LKEGQMWAKELEIYHWIESYVIDVDSLVLRKKLYTMNGAPKGK